MEKIQTKIKEFQGENALSKITMENFSNENRTKFIGATMYRICKNHDTKIWYIYKQYNDKESFSQTKIHHNENLQIVIDIFNSINEE